MFSENKIFPENLSLLKEKFIINLMKAVILDLKFWPKPSAKTDQYVLISDKGTWSDTVLLSAEEEWAGAEHVQTFHIFILTSEFSFHPLSYFQSF